MLGDWLGGWSGELLLVWELTALPGPSAKARGDGTHYPELARRGNSKEDAQRRGCSNEPPPPTVDLRFFRMHGAIPLTTTPHRILERGA
ncbi:MAG: hypothetical protein GY820_25230, partial [Gammaproteobacteria bacterium]|nr:hypothetical protein [Gammaproteobacteria bacterium]